MKLVNVFLVTIALWASVPLLVMGQDCSNFCVWPGDANNNGKANHFDVLQLGIAYDATGIFRADNSVGWSAKEADDWTGSFATNNANFKHADSNGDGFIDEFDIFPMGDNFNEEHALFDGTPEGNNIPGLDLTATLNQNNYSDGQTATITVSLGTPENPITDLIGLAFSIEIDTEYVQQVIEPVTWEFGLIGPEADLLLFDKWEPGISDAIHFAFARTNGIPVNGYGPILTIEVIIIDDLSLRYSEPQPYEIKIKDVLGIDINETDLLVTNQGDEATLLLTSSTESLEQINAKVMPNPFEDEIHIQGIDADDMNQINIHDALGRLVLSQGKGTSTLQTGHLPPGLYIMHIQTDNGNYSQKIVKQE